MYGTPFGCFNDASSSPLSNRSLLKSAIGYQESRPIDTRLQTPRLACAMGATSSFHAVGDHDLVNPFSTAARRQIAGNNSLQPSVLVPVVKITPECRVLGDGKSAFWTAIEISTKLNTTASNHENAMRHPTSSEEHAESQLWDGSTDLTAYGYLYDFHVELLPKPQSRINEVLGYETTPVIFLPGSKCLILANISLLSRRQSGAKPHLRERSEDLMEDLEIQLGSAGSEYMEIRLTYSHSAFPRKDGRGESSQIASVKTRLETVVSAVIECHNPSSPWSPPPAPTPNRMFDIVVSHWGKAAVDDLVRKPMISQQVKPRKAATVAYKAPAAMDGLAKSCSVNSLRNGVPSIPSRRASLRQSSFEKTLDPARKIWAEMRRTSSSSRSYRKSSTFTCPPTTEHSSTCLGLPSIPSRGEVGRRRQTLRETALRNQRSVGADTMRSLVPTTTDLSIDEKPVHNYRNGKENEALNTKSKKDSGRWPWASWW